MLNLQRLNRHPARLNSPAYDYRPIAAAAVRNIDTFAQLPTTSAREMLVDDARPMSNSRPFAAFSR